MKSLLAEPSVLRVAPKGRLDEPSQATTDTEPHPKAPTELWPPAGVWTRQQQRLERARFHRLGLDPKLRVHGKPASQVFAVLGRDSFCEFSAVNVPGKVIWCNFDLARRLGFAVPNASQLTPELEAELLAAFSLRAVVNPDDANESAVTVMYADRYGGDGVLPALGAGRAGFLSYGNCYVKGVGFTPLFKHDDPDDFAHSHGEVHMDDCMLEAIFGEVNETLLTSGSARVLAIIDQGRHVTSPPGKHIPVALVVRCGTQLRPAHLLGRHLLHGNARLEIFVRIARATGQLVTQRVHDALNVPDIRLSILRIIDDHARTAAEMFRWRMIHGAISASNMEMSSAMLDLPTQSAQPRTAAIRALDYDNSIFGQEHTERALQLAVMYRALVDHTPKLKRAQFNITHVDFVPEMDQAYDRHLQVQLLCAAGLKRGLAVRIQTDLQDLATRFTGIILRMMALKNPGTTCTWRAPVDSVSVLDVFHLLQRFPKAYFRHPTDDHTEMIGTYLRPVFRGSPKQIARKQARVDKLVCEFALVYEQLMRACTKYAPQFYSTVQHMRASIKARAAFENEPLELLYSLRLRAELNHAITVYRASGDATPLLAAIEQRIQASSRSVDNLLAQGRQRRLTGGGVELQLRNLNGVNFSVRACADEAQTPSLHVSIPVERKGRNYLSAVPGLPGLTRRQIHSLRYRFTTHGEKQTSYVDAYLKHSTENGYTIGFADITSCPIVGRLAGVLELRAPGALVVRERVSVSSYAFVLPDARELQAMI